MSEGSGPPSIPGAEAVVRAANWLRRMTSLILKASSQIETLTRQNADLEREVRALRDDFKDLRREVKSAEVEMRAAAQTTASDAANRALIPLVERIVRVEVRTEE